MYKFFSFVSWYYIVVTLLWAISAYKDVKAGNKLDSDGMDLDVTVIAFIYLTHYYLGVFS